MCEIKNGSLFCKTEVSYIPLDHILADDPLPKKG